MEKGHNGWANYETWKLIVNLDNVEYNYRRIKNEGKNLLRLKRLDLIQEIFTSYYIMDSINKSKLSSKDIKRYIEDIIGGDR